MRPFVGRRSGKGNGAQVHRRTAHRAEARHGRGAVPGRHLARRRACSGSTARATKYVSDLWKVPTDGSAPLQLTRGDSKDASPCFRRDGALGVPVEPPAERGQARRGRRQAHAGVAAARRRRRTAAADRRAARRGRVPLRAQRRPPGAAGARAARRRAREAARGRGRAPQEGQQRAQVHRAAGAPLGPLAARGRGAAEHARHRLRGRRHRSPRPDAAGAPRTGDRARSSTCRATAGRSRSRGRPPARTASSTARSC